MPVHIENTDNDLKSGKKYEQYPDNRGLNATPCCMTSYQSSFNPFSNKPWFLRVCSTSLLKTLWEKEKLLVTSNFFLFYHCVFYPFGELSTIFIKFEIVVCKLFQFGRVLKFVVWESFNYGPMKSFYVSQLTKSRFTMFI